MKKSFRKVAAAALALTMVSACMPAFTTISTTVGGNAIVASAKEEIDTSKPFTLTFSLTGDTVVDADGRPVGKFKFMRYYRRTKNGVEVINLPYGGVNIYVNSNYIGVIGFTFTLNGIVHYENRLDTDNFKFFSMYVPTNLNEFKITFTPKGYKSETEKPTEPVIETQKPTEPVIETQKPTEPVIETQEPIAPYIEEPTEEVQAGYTVILNSFGDSKMPVIKAVSVATGLTLKEAKDIVDNAPCTIKENVSEDEAKNIIIKVQAAGGTASANDLEIETIEETIQQTGITVTLDSFGASKLPVIKAIREAAGLTLKEAKDIVDNAPCTIKENVSEDEAKNIIIKVQEAGGTASSKGLKTETVEETAVEETAVDETATEFTVTLDSFGNATVPVIKVVREITGLSLKEAKALVESAPCTLKENVSKEEAEDIINKIQTAGGTASKS